MFFYFTQFQYVYLSRKKVFYQKMLMFCSDVYLETENFETVWEFFQLLTWQFILNPYICQKL